MEMLTEREIDVMKHATGWPQNYRNYFAAGGKDVETWRGLVGKGLAYERNTSVCPDPLFHVTDEGKALLAALSHEEGK
jgi:hypothetical protein